MDLLTPLEQSYQKIMDPINFVKNFPTREHFKQWARTGMINDLKNEILTFERYELYEHCAMMQDVIDEKVDEMLSGFGFE
jgi:hypothetical protein